MAQVCYICGKKPVFGYNISHAHNKTKRRWNINLHRVKAYINGTPRRIKVCTSCLRRGVIKRAV
ncbi:MAG: 50S ribosomal protein L28 [Fidelibacterota bacterium]